MSKKREDKVNMTISVPFSFREALDHYAHNRDGRTMSDILVEATQRQHPELLDYRQKIARRVLPPE